jgi:hypothetical protein
MLAVVCLSACPGGGPAGAGRVAGPLAFPGAEGFGAHTPGGRGGKVIHVTNLDPSGPGSLQEACSTPGPRIVVFDVGGVIVGDVVIAESFITIAGQTAPSPGITVNGMLSTAYRPRDPVHDVIVRYLRVRARPGGGDQGDTIQFSVVDNAILDHVSCSWAEDETIDIYTRATNVTIQWCTIEESSITGHPKGRHNYGLISGADSYNISIHHDLFAHHARRNPAIGSGPADFRNNVVYDFRDGWSHEGNYKNPGFNIIGNYYKRGPSDPDIFPFCFEDKVPYYLRGNYIEGVGIVDDPWAEADKLEGLRYYADKGVKLDREVAVAPVKTQSAQEIYRQVLASAGCFPRDAVSRRTIEEVENGTGSWGRHEPKDLMEGLVVAKLAKDTDRDGMPDEWEKAHGLDPSKDDSGKVMDGGYTAIEGYINGLAVQMTPAV